MGNGGHILKVQSILITIIIIILVSISGCTETDIQTEEDKFIGKWAYILPAYFGSENGWDNRTGNLTFLRNGTLKIKRDVDSQWNKTIYWEWLISEGKLILHDTQIDNIGEFNYEFHDNNLTLYLFNKDGNISQIWVKKD